MISTVPPKDVISHGLSCAAKKFITMDLPAYLPGTPCQATTSGGGSWLHNLWSRQSGWAIGDRLPRIITPCVRCETPSGNMQFSLTGWHNLWFELHIFTQIGQFACKDSGKTAISAFFILSVVIMQGNLCFDNACFATQVSEWDIYTHFLFLQQDVVCYLYKVSLGSDTFHNAYGQGFAWPKGPFFPLFATPNRHFISL